MTADQNKGQLAPFFMASYSFNKDDWDKPKNGNGIKFLKGI